MPDIKKLTFVMACMTVFGRKPGQTLQDFNVELKQLNETDRAYFSEGFKAVGIEVVGGIGSHR